MRRYQFKLLYIAVYYYHHYIYPCFIERLKAKIDELTKRNKDLLMQLQHCKKELEKENKCKKNVGYIS